MSGAIGDQNWTDRFPVPIAEWDKHWPDKVAKLGAMMRETGRYGGRGPRLPRLLDKLVEAIGSNGMKTQPVFGRCI